MPEYVTLDRFGASERHYYIYRIKSTALDHQSHYHNYYQVCFVARGEIVHHQGGDAVTLRAGDAFIVPPGFIHALHFEGVNTELYSLAFDTGLFEAGFSQSNAYRFLEELHTGSEAVRKKSVRLRVVLDENQRRLVRHLLDCLISQQRADYPRGLSAAPSIVESVLYLLAQSYYSQPSRAGQFSEKVSCSTVLRQCIAYVDGHYKERLTVDDLTRRFGISRSAFCAVFPQIAGMPLRKYIAYKRIMEAQMLIRSRPEWSLSRVAAESGYEDLTTFYRNFLQITGVAPSRYRELCSGTE